RDETIGDVVGAGTAVFLGNRYAEQAERSHLGEDLAVRTLLEVGRDHARGELLLAVVARRVADHALVLSELIFEQQRVVPLEGRSGGLGFGGFVLHCGLPACRWVCLGAYFIISM